MTSMILTDDMEMLSAIYGKDNYRGNFSGKRTKMPYHIFVSSEPTSFNLTAYYMENYKSIIAGYYMAMLVNNTHNDPRKHLHVPISLEQNIFLSNAQSIIKNDGVAGFLLDALIHEFKSRGGVHVVSFTDDGFKKIKSRYDKLDYKRLYFLENAQIPKWATELKSWMYYDYDKRKPIKTQVTSLLYSSA